MGISYGNPHTRGWGGSSYIHICCHLLGRGAAAHTPRLPRSPVPQAETVAQHGEHVRGRRGGRQRHGAHAPAKDSLQDQQQGRRLLKESTARIRVRNHVSCSTHGTRGGSCEEARPPRTTRAAAPTLPAFRGGGGASRSRLNDLRVSGSEFLKEFLKEISAAGGVLRVVPVGVQAGAVGGAHEDEEQLGALLVAPKQVLRLSHQPQGLPKEVTQRAIHICAHLRLPAVPSTAGLPKGVTAGIHIYIYIYTRSSPAPPHPRPSLRPAPPTQAASQGRGAPPVEVKGDTCQSMGGYGRDTRQCTGSIPRTRCSTYEEFTVGSTAGIT